MTQHGMALCIVIKPLPPHQYSIPKYEDSHFSYLKAIMNLDHFFSLLKHRESNSLS